MKASKSSILQYLEREGWTELIDSRYERQLIKEILFVFPDTPSELLEEILDIILVGNRGDSIEVTN